MDDSYSEMRFVSKAELAHRFGISRETLRLKLKGIKELDTGKRQLLYPWEVRLVYQCFGLPRNLKEIVPDEKKQ